MFPATKVNVILPSQYVWKREQRYVLIYQHGYLENCQCGITLAIWWEILPPVRIVRTTSFERAVAIWYFCA